MSLQSWDEHSENHDAFMKRLAGCGFVPHEEMAHWRRRFYWLLVLGSVLVLWLFMVILSRH